MHIALKVFPLFQKGFSMDSELVHTVEATAANVHDCEHLLRKFALSLLKRYKAETNTKQPISHIMPDCLLEPEYLCRVLQN